MNKRKIVDHVRIYEPMIENSLKRLWVGIALIILTPLFSFGVYFCINHNLDGIQDWLIPVSAFEFLITAAIGSWVTVNNYTLKIETEKRQIESSSVESNVRLFKLFSEMMQIANSRYEPILSEKVIEGLFNNKIITANDYTKENIRILSEKLETAVFIPPYGLAAQESAIAAIYTLGREHTILLDAAIEGLSSVKSYFIANPRFGKDSYQVKLIEKNLNELNELKSNK